MFWFLILIPLATVSAAFLLYRQVGKRDFFKLDIVQFMYAFVFSPLAFIWMKSLLLAIVRNEVGFILSPNQVFIIDTTFSVIFLYIFAFIAIHSLTKTYEVKLQRDPLFNILAHSEQFHLWISHTVIYLLTGLIFLLLGFVNLWLPVSLETSRFEFFSMVSVGVVLGFVLFSAIWLSNFTAYKFLRLIKLVYGIYFSLLCVAYFVASPNFSGSYVLYWFVTSTFFGLLIASQVVKRSERSRKFIRRFHHKHRQGWSEQNFLLLNVLKDTVSSVSKPKKPLQ